MMRDDDRMHDGWVWGRGWPERLPAPLPVLPSRPADGHKGTFGTVLVVGGCDWMVGAPSLTARAAFRIGAGLVKLAVDSSLVQACLTIEPGASAVGLGDDAESSVALLEAADPKRRGVLAVGPGMGRAATAVDLVRALTGNVRPMVLDADGLNIVSAHSDIRNSLARFSADRPSLIVTPHPGEFARLAEAYSLAADARDAIDDDARPRAACALAKAMRAVVVLKGRGTVVSDGVRWSVNPTGTAALATAGSGDILTGVIAGLVAQGLEPYDAAVSGAYLHGLAGQMWSSVHGDAGLRAMDLADVLPDARQAAARAWSMRGSTCSTESMGGTTGDGDEGSEG